jgi:hypothetical protein
MLEEHVPALLGPLNASAESRRPGMGRNAAVAIALSSCTEWCGPDRAGGGDSYPGSSSRRMASPARHDGGDEAASPWLHRGGSTATGMSLSATTGRGHSAAGGARSSAGRAAAARAQAARQRRWDEGSDGGGSEGYGGCLRGSCWAAGAYLQARGLSSHRTHFSSWCPTPPHPT